MKKGNIKRDFPEHLQKLYDDVGKEVGIRSEEMFDRLFSEPPEGCELPVWYKYHIRSKKDSKLDHSCVDFIIYTDFGDLRVNVKSSDHGVRMGILKHMRYTTTHAVNARSKHMPICFVHVDTSKEPSLVFRMVMETLEEHIKNPSKQRLLLFDHKRKR